MDSACQSRSESEGSPGKPARPRVIYLLGMWLMFGCQISLLLIGLALIVSNLMAPIVGTRVADAVVLLIALGLLVINTVFLWRMTARFVTQRRAVRRYARGLCVACGYDLRGTVEAQREACPECGTAVPAAS